MWWWRARSSNIWDAFILIVILASCSGKCVAERGTGTRGGLHPLHSGTGANHGDQDGPVLVLGVQSVPRARDSLYQA
jgi:hypothetical protein